MCSLASHTHPPDWVFFFMPVLHDRKREIVLLELGSWSLPAAFVLAALVNSFSILTQTGRQQKGMKRREQFCGMLPGISCPQLLCQRVWYSVPADINILWLLSILSSTRGFEPVKHFAPSVTSVVNYFAQGFKSVTILC